MKHPTRRQNFANTLKPHCAHYLTLRLKIKILEFQICSFRGTTIYSNSIHYFTLVSSELHYLDIILKIENLTLMSSASGKFDINVLSIWENHLSNTNIFVILPVLFLFSHVLNAGEQLQLLIYALLSLKCRELHLRVF